MIKNSKVHWTAAEDDVLVAAVEHHRSGAIGPRALRNKFQKRSVKAIFARYFRVQNGTASKRLGLRHAAKAAEQAGTNAPTELMVGKLAPPYRGIAASLLRQGWSAEQVMGLIKPTKLTATQLALVGTLYASHRAVTIEERQGKVVILPGNSSN